MSLYTIKAILILDVDGKRLCAKYYTNDLPTFKEQEAFEKKLFAKTSKANSEIFIWENLVAVYKSTADVYFYVLGSSEENELLLMGVVNGIMETVTRLLQNQIDKRTMLENLDYVMLTVDEVCDRGIIFEIDPDVLVKRVAMKSADTEVPIGEQTLSQFISGFKQAILKG
eukprot:TRINITY_DN19880_c0_g1_i1.p1 TRINITY_DN19880_c0_g1~~TRINITY_DN19880_c0_g1_i1.p1  ORF type:complete len:170 (+),score=30.02 TRINITY_DN19880_c0_g1_i1:31-540(+)